MKIGKIAGFAAAVLVSLSLTACSGTDDQEQGGASLVDDGTGAVEVTEGVDADGTLTVTSNYDEQAWHGPAELKTNNTIYFNYDSDQIQEQQIGVMQTHAQYLRNNPHARIIIEGHTDERGTPEYNVALGERRARSVARYMQNLGVDVNQLSIVSYGEEKPIDPGHNESAWSKNRRAVLNY